MMEDPIQQTKTILLVEDDKTHVKFIRRAFEESKSNWEIHSVATLSDAIKWLEEKKQTSLIITDYLLPDGMGIELIEKMGIFCEAEVPIPVIILTAFGSEQLAVLSIKFGAVDYITKTVENFRTLPWTAERGLREWENIIERKRVEKELKKHTKELERANRELKNYAYTISHDLKNPLYSIQAISRFLIYDYADKLDKKGQNYLDMLKKTSVEMVELITDLLLLSRVGRQYAEFELIDLNALVEEIKTEQKMQIEECCGEVVTRKELPNIYTIKIWMKELLKLLIGNGLRLNESEKRQVEVNCEKREKEKDYLFMVKDNGIGIEEEEQDKIFTLFFTPSSQLKYGSTGVDLCICKKIITELGGKIWVDSKPGEGSTFWFIIPELYRHFSSGSAVKKE